MLVSELERVVLAPVPVLAWLTDRVPMESGSQTREINALPRLLHPSAPTYVPSVPVTERSPAPDPETSSGQAPGHVSMPWRYSPIREALCFPAGPSPGGCARVLPRSAIECHLSCGHEGCVDLGQCDPSRPIKQPPGEQGLPGRHAV